MSRPRLLLGVSLIWALASAILLWIARPHIAGLEMWDPDDYLRLQQVRDWLGGQGFFDVTQYRIDPPGGVPMHWSRIVDLPLAGLILLLQPLFGPWAAERIAVSAVPLVTLAGSLSAVALITARLADRRVALLAAMLAATAPLLLFHVLPLRIDHHGWQTMLGLLAIAACFDPRQGRGGVIAGIATALWLAISLEALPMAAAIALLLAARYLIWGEARRFGAFCAALGLATLALFAALHDRAGWTQPWCDAVSPGWFGPLLLSPLLAALSVRVTARSGLAPRLAGLLVAGGIGIALLAATAPACLAGPFGQLDPVVRHHWYQKVREGLPFWRQDPGDALVLILFPLVGIAGTLLARRHAADRAPDGTAARNWLAMLGLLLAAYAVSLLVQRAGGFAQGCALPGAAWLLGRARDRVGAWRYPAFRVIGSMAAIVALSPIGAMLAGGLLLAGFPRNVADASSETAACMAPCASLASLARLPRATILTGLDLTPRLLVETPHSYAASGHHRGRAAMRRVIDAFLGPPGTAHRLMRDRHMAYLLIDPAGHEALLYARAAPGGLMARLLKGEAPAWLEPVPLGTDRLRMWRRVD
ncbi:hypothetical protein [Rhizorhabdus dicambivorans]|uniref:hypothetical protein n=1 Tax=Rhizorhabdus dicambivorans TaxID=1850238 RepID=UPI001EDD63A5|nr:hypothetical protein [Rhizorhabdus dicambivorans]